MPEVIVRRVRGEYLEMPGLHLTPRQAARLWGLDQGAILSTLVESAFLKWTGSGAFARADAG